jgi:hypothetical protein
MASITTAQPHVPFVLPEGEGMCIPAVPPGWKVQRVGAIAGDLMEVAFDPERHDIAVVWDSHLSLEAGHAISLHGWSPLACTDDAQVWSRDRLDRVSRAPADVSDPAGPAQTRGPAL